MIFEVITVSTAVISAIAAILAAVFSYIDSKKIQDVHLSLNSRLDAFIKAAELAGRTQGASDALAQDKQARAEARAAALGHPPANEP